MAKKKFVCALAILTYGDVTGVPTVVTRFQEHKAKNTRQAN